MSNVTKSSYICYNKLNKMKRLTLIGIILIGMFGCINEPQSTETVGKDGTVRIDFLFEKDGIKVYRFIDGGRFHYFTTNGETTTEQTSGETTYDEHIQRKSLSKISDEKF